MNGRTSKANGKGYYAVQFEVVAEGKYAEAIASFRQIHYDPNFIRLIEAKKKEAEKEAD